MTLTGKYVIVFKQKEVEEHNNFGDLVSTETAYSPVYEGYVIKESDSYVKVRKLIRSKWFRKIDPFTHIEPVETIEE